MIGIDFIQKYGMLPTLILF